MLTIQRLLLQALRSVLPMIFMGTLTLLLIACRSGTSTDPYINYTDEAIYVTGHNALTKNNLRQAIQAFESLENNYPFGEYTEQGQLELIYTYYKFNDNPAALATAQRFIQLHPTHPHLDYVYYMRGVIAFNENVGFFERFLPIDPSRRDPNPEEQAALNFNEMIRLFPDSIYAPDARRRLTYIRNSLANYELYAAQYALQRGAYVAAAERANNVIQHYDHAPAVPEALSILSTTYRELGLDDLASDIDRVRAANAAQATAS